MEMSTLKAKLKPTRFDGISPLMAAIVGYVLEVYYYPPIPGVNQWLPDVWKQRQLAENKSVLIRQA